MSQAASQQGSFGIILFLDLRSDRLNIMARRRIFLATFVKHSTESFNFPFILGHFLPDRVIVKL